MTSPSADAGRRLPRRFRFVGHLMVFAAVGLALLLAEFLLGASWRLFWPLFAWSVLLAIHYFVASAFDPPHEHWVEDRVMDLQTRSYDFDHIKNIEKRFEEKDDSIIPHTERDT